MNTLTQNGNTESTTQTAALWNARIAITLFQSLIFSSKIVRLGALLFAAIFIVGIVVFQTITDGHLPDDGVIRWICITLFIIPFMMHFAFIFSTVYFLPFKVLSMATSRQFAGLKFLRAHLFFQVFSFVILGSLLMTLLIYNSPNNSREIWQSFPAFLLIGSICLLAPLIFGVMSPHLVSLGFISISLSSALFRDVFSIPTFKIWLILITLWTIAFVIWMKWRPTKFVRSPIDAARLRLNAVQFKKNKEFNIGLPKWIRGGEFDAWDSACLLRRNSSALSAIKVSLVTTILFGGIALYVVPGFVMLIAGGSYNQMSDFFTKMNFFLFVYLGFVPSFVSLAFSMSIKKLWLTTCSNRNTFFNLLESKWLKQYGVQLATTFLVVYSYLFIAQSHTGITFVFVAFLIGGASGLLGFYSTLITYLIFNVSRITVMVPMQLINVFLSLSIIFLSYFEEGTFIEKHLSQLFFVSIALFLLAFITRAYAQKITQRIEFRAVL